MENKKPRTTSAKKPVEKKEIIVEAPIMETPVMETPVMEAPVTRAPKKVKPSWEIKDRRYYLMNGKSPVSYVIPSKHTARKPLLYFDEETNTQREIRYASNQNSVFVDEQEGAVTLAHVAFEDGVLAVGKQNQALQKLLSLYHPLKGYIYLELDEVEVAEDNLDDLELEFEAMTSARSMDVDFAEAIMRAEIGSKVSKMSSSELKRDLYIFAKENPGLFLELANDENVQLRNIAIRASEMGIIRLSQDQRTFTWASNGRKLMTVPFDEHPYSAMAAYFKTDEGMEVFSSIEKKLA
tara:strand:+ start:101 stop:985 length:885 start_codon:yes stop_codon:yes gene_type:complete